MIWRFISARDGIRIEHSFATQSEALAAWWRLRRDAYVSAIVAIRR